MSFKQRIRPLAAWLAVLAVSLVPASRTFAYSTVPGSCATSTTYPVHGNAQAGTGGFSVTPSSLTYEAGQPLTVTLNGSQSFKGLLLYAFDSGGLHRGTFAIPSGYQPMNSCAGDPSSTVGHSNANSKSAPIAFSWTAPSANEALFFVAAIMVDFSHFYVLDPVQITPTVNGVDANEGAGSGAALALSVEPNPSVTHATIRYALPREDAVSLRVYDLHGRLLRSIEIGRQGAGEHSFDWDGRNDQGELVGAGVYFLRADAGAAVQAVKFLRMEASAARR